MTWIHVSPQYHPKPSSSAYGDRPDRPICCWETMLSEEWVAEDYFRVSILLRTPCHAHRTFGQYENSVKDRQRGLPSAKTLELAED